MYVQVALSFGLANYIQYATFLASRAYLASRTTEQKQIEAASDTLKMMVGENSRWPMIIRAVGDGNPRGASIGRSNFVEIPPRTSNARFNNWEQGVAYRFQMRLYTLPILKSKSLSSSGNFVEVQSQSFLGREPSEDECRQYMENEFGPKNGERAKIANDYKIKFYYDNGC